MPFAFPKVEEVDDSDYLGGYREVYIDASPALVMATLLNIESYREILPMLRSFNPLPMSPEGHLMSEVDEGGSLGHARYTARVERRGDTVRFWVDRTQPHEIEDAFGWFKIAEEGSGTLVKFRVWIDVGSSLTESLFGGKIEHVALQIPERLRRHVESLNSKLGASPGPSAGSAEPPVLPPPQGSPQSTLPGPRKQPALR